MGLSLIIYEVKVFAVGTDEVMKKSFGTDAVTKFSVGNISVTEAVTNTYAHFFSKNFTWY